MKKYKRKIIMNRRNICGFEILKFQNFQPTEIFQNFRKL